MPIFIIAGYVRQTLERGAFLVPPSMSSPEKAHPEYWRVKRLTKTTVFSRKLNFLENISFLEKSFQLILSPLFLKPRPFHHSVSWSNMLIKMKFSKQVIILLLYIWLSHFCQWFPFYNPWRHWKPYGLLVLPGDIKWGHWLEIGRYKQVPNQCYEIKPNLNI